VKDHLGNTYNSISEMCKHYGIRYQKYCYRKRAGWDIERILTMNRKQFRDHLGNKFDSFDDMCKHYNIGVSTVRSRLSSGMSLKDALSCKNAVYDHLGNTFSSITAMCSYYGVHRTTYIERLNRGYSQERALTLTAIDTSNRKKVKDHIGNEFKSFEDMCDYYKLKSGTVRYRLNNGYTLEEALLTKVGQNKYNGEAKVVDHLGNEYYSLKSMLDKYGISKLTFRNRIRQGADIETALTYDSSKDKDKLRINLQGPDGYRYNSLKEMCEQNRISFGEYYSKLIAGYTLEEILDK